MQTLDPWFVVKTMDWPHNPRIARAQSVDWENPGIFLCKPWIHINYELYEMILA